jgi:hypothetical protein
VTETPETALRGPAATPAVHGEPNRPPKPPGVPHIAATGRESTTRSHRTRPDAEERALADHIAARATALRDDSGDGISIKEAVRLALMQMGLA